MPKKSGRLTKKERLALESFSDGPAEVPHGIGPVLIFRLLNRNWIYRAEREYDFGPERYAITPEGKTALQADVAAG